MNILWGISATGTGVMTPDQRLVSSNTALMAQANNAVLNKDQNCGTHLTEDSETKRYTITQQLAAMTIENSNKDVGSSKEGMDRLAMSSGAVVLLTSGSGSTQYAVQVIFLCSPVFSVFFRCSGKRNCCWSINERNFFRI
jgi:hypothetical protein